jgi:hypothetical protein
MKMVVNSGANGYSLSRKTAGQAVAYGVQPGRQPCSLYYAQGMPADRSKVNTHQADIHISIQLG